MEQIKTGIDTRMDREEQSNQVRIMAIRCLLYTSIVKTSNHPILKIRNGYYVPSYKKKTLYYKAR